MRWIKFIAKKNMDDYFTFILYVVVIALFTFFAGFTISTISYERECKSILNVEDNCYSFRPYELDYKLDTVPNGVTLDGGVVYLGDLFTDGGALVYSCSSYFFKNAKLKFEYKEGKGFSDNPDEVIVVKGSGYKVGDRIQIYKEDSCLEECVVVGILKYPVFLEDTSCSTSSYCENDDYDGNHPYEYFFTSYINSEAPVLFLNPNSKLMGEAINDCYGFLFTDNSEMLKQFEADGDIERINDLKNYREDFFCRDEAILDICLFVLFVCGIVVHNYFATKKDIREYGIYFMLGITKKKMYLLLSMKNAFSFFVGFLLGSSFLFRAYKIGYENMIFKISNQMLVLLVCFGLYILSIIPVLIQFKRLKIVQLIKDKD